MKKLGTKHNKCFSKRPGNLFYWPAPHWCSKSLLHLKFLPYKFNLLILQCYSDYFLDLKNIGKKQNQIKINVIHTGLILPNSLQKQRAEKKLLPFLTQQPPQVHTNSFFHDQKLFFPSAKQTHCVVLCDVRKGSENNVPKSLFIFCIHELYSIHYYNKHCKYFSQPPKLPAFNDFYSFTFYFPHSVFTT